MRSVLIRCYPARWRARYGDEFLAILEERPLGPYDVADIVLGALDARLRSRRDRAATPQGRGFTMSLRLGGIAAIVGAAILGFAWFTVFPGAISMEPIVLMAMFVVGLGALLVALTILSAFQARTLPRLVWTAFALAAVGVVAYVVGLLGLIGVTEGAVTSGSAAETAVTVAYAAGGLAAVVGFALFGVATYRSGELSRPGAVLLAAGPALMVGAWLVAFTVAWDLGGLMMLGAVGCFLTGWVVLGIAAIRLDGRKPEARPA